MKYIVRKGTSKVKSYIYIKYVASRSFIFTSCRSCHNFMQVTMSQSFSLLKYSYPSKANYAFTFAPTRCDRAVTNKYFAQEDTPVTKLYPARKVTSVTNISYLDLHRSTFLKKHMSQTIFTILLIYYNVRMLQNFFSNICHKCHKSQTVCSSFYPYSRTCFFQAVAVTSVTSLMIQNNIIVVDNIDTRKFLC